MSSAPSLTEVQEVFEALGPPGTPFTTTEVATRFECTDRTIYNRLETLVEDGVLETKKVGARGRIWWRPVEGDGENERNTEETYQKLFESINEGLCIIEVLFDADEQPVDYRFLETNPVFDERTGLRDAAGKRIRELDVDHNDHWIEKYGAVAQTGESVQFTEYAEDLGERWYEINAFRIGDPTEHTVAVLFDDITENKHAENAVDEGEKRLEALLEATTEGVYRITPDWSEIYQLAGENFIADDPPNTWQEYIPEDDRERVGEAIEEAIETQSPFELEHRITRADGTIGWVDSSAVPIVEDGEIVEWVGTATDITERKEQQREKDLLWQAIEKANSPLIMAEPGEDDNPIVYANEAFEQLSGYTESELLGQDCRLLQGENTRKEPVRELRGAIDNEEQVTVELRNYRKDGTEFWNRVTVAPVYDIDGNLIRFLGTQEDITGRKERELELQRYEQYLESVSDLVTVVDDDGVILYESSGLNEMLGYDATERIGDSGFDYIHPDDREWIKKQFRNLIVGKETSRSKVEYRARTKGGNWIWLESRAYDLADNQGEGDIVLTTRDITERKEQERKRQEVVDRVTDGIIEVDADWRCTFINGKGGELANTSEPELLGRTFWEVFEDARGTAFEKKYREVMDTREPVSFVEYYPKLDGWFDVQAYPNDDDGVAIYFRDVTERKEREQARQRAEKRYQKLLKLAPIPIIAVDPKTEEILEANEAAGELIGCQPDELIGRMRASVHPTENSDGYDTIFKKATERGGTWRYLPDGSPTYVVTEHGEEIPVEIIGKKIELEGDDVVYGILQDISDQLEYQHRLQNLNEVTHELFNAETEQEVTQTAVEALADILERSTVGFYSFNEDEWKLEPVVHTTSNEEAEEIAQLPVFDPGVGVEWHAFADGQTTIVDDFQNRETEYEFDRTIRSELAVPIADWGVLVVGDTRPDIFADWTANLVETLGATLSSALDHTEREQELREQRRELREIESLNQQIRDITHTIVQTDSRVELEQSICERLVESDLIEFAWIGNVDLENKTVTPRAQAGAGDTYLDNVSLTLDRNTDPEPSVQALQSRDVCGSSNVTTNIQHSDWRGMAVEQGFRSVLSVPLVYREALYGTLTVYSQTTSGFPDELESVLQELCNLIAHATAAIEQKEALQTTQTAELEFEVRDEETLFCRFATVLDCEIELERIVPQKGESTLAFFSVADGTLEKLPEEANRLDGIEGGHLLKRANDTLIQLRITEPCIASVLSDRGLLLRRLFADSTQCRLTVEVPKSFDPRQAVNIIMSQYEDVQLLAKHESDTSFDPSFDTILDALTPRQSEVVETAYRVGYFDSPRRVSGKDVAEMFDFSNSTFHEHIRKAEQTLFENLIEDTSSPLVR